MLLTEEEAKKKQCPHTTYCHNEVQVCQGNTSAVMVPSDCCASECMAWRWANEPRRTKQDFDNTIKVERVGFCGLAGRPTV